VHDVAVGDLDGDGDEDLVVANYDLSAPTASVLLGAGDGSFGAPTAYPVGGQNAASVVVADLDGDGDLDAAVASRDDGAVSVLLGDGTGALGAADVQAAAGGPVSIRAGDLDGDALPELVLAHSLSHKVSVMQNLGSGAFGAPVLYAADNSPRAVALGDLNQDGRLDVVATNWGSDNATVLAGLGDGTLAPAGSLVLQDNPSGTALADVDADGKLDLLAVNWGAATVSVLANVGGAWTSLGSALAGSNGEPALTGTGALSTGSSNALALSEAKASSPVTLVFGLGVLGAPFKGGVMVPDPLLFLPLTTNGDGALLLPFTLPAVPSGLPLTLQVWLADPAGSVGYAASNALEGVTS
jgi:hypothetical protein